MIIMINGAFGVGKTTAAEGLVKAIPDAILYDPEIIGYTVRELTKNVRTPDEETDDFQDITIWRPLVIAGAEHLRRRYARPLIVPMTLANLNYLEEIRAGFQSLDPAVYHFCLTASLPTILGRLEQRDGMNSPWARKKAVEYVPRFSAPQFAAHIDAEYQPCADIVGEILNHLGLGSG